MTLKKCPECNNEIRNNDNICIYCGYKLDTGDLEIIKSS